MSYGPTKYPAPEMQRSILEVIGDQMSRFSAFNNTSIGYFGARIKYRIEIELFSRQESKEIVQKEAALGECPTPDEKDNPALEIESTPLVVEGEKSAGRVPKSPEVVGGDKSEEKTGQKPATGAAKRPPETESNGDVSGDKQPLAAARHSAGKAGGHRPPVTT